MRVYTNVPDYMATPAGVSLAAAGIEHVRGDPEAAASDPACIALIGPFRSREIAMAAEITAPTGLPLFAPVATWAGVTRDDEPGCDDNPAEHDGTILRMVARDTEVAWRIAGYLAGGGRRALVVAGDHEYGEQLNGQLDLAGLQRAESAADADAVVLCGLRDEPEIARVRELPLEVPIIAFDGVQGSDVGAGRDVRLALPFAPGAATVFDFEELAAERAVACAQLIAAATRAGCTDRSALLSHVRAAGGFDEHGDLGEAPVWLWQADENWTLRPDRAI